MTMRSTLSDAARRAQTVISRSTIREMDDDHLCQEVKEADVFHSETPSNFEMWHPLGITSVAMKQAQEQGQQGQDGGQGGGAAGGAGGGGGDNQWSDKQPKGEAAEAMMLYVNGSRAHPVAMVNDRRVRPYGMKPGEGAFYSPEGSGQMLYHRVHGDGADGLYLLTCNDQGGSGVLRADGTQQQQQSRFISIRHVNKKKQRRKKQKQQGGGGNIVAFADGGGQSSGSLPDDSKSGYKHEGDSVNTEMRYTDSQLQYYDGGTNVGHYDRGGKDWLHHDGQGAKHSMRADKNHSHIKHESNHIWVDEGNCKSSKPIIIEPDECK